MPAEAKKPWVTPARVLFLMTAMFFLIYLDRGTMSSSAVNGTEKDEDDESSGSGLQGEFGLSNLQDGILSSMFMIGMSIGIPICSEAVYRVNAFRLAGASLAVWTVATILCGFSFDFYSIAFCRMFVGVGEAAIISLAPPYIDDNAPPKKKTLWLAFLFLAVPVGYAAGYGYGGLVTSLFGWRAAFIAEGIMMAPLVVFCFLATPLELNMRTSSGLSEPTEQGKSLSTFWRHAKEILSHRVYPNLLLGYSCYMGFIGVVAYWGAKAAKSVYDLQDVVTGAITAITGLCGALLGGWTLDRVGSTIPRALGMSAICCFIPGVMIGMVGLWKRPALPLFVPTYSFLNLLLFAIQAPIQATVLWCVPPNHRTLANGLSVLVIHLLGDVPFPPLFGALLDHFKDNEHLEESEAYMKSLAVISFILVVAAAFFLRAAKIGRTARDYRSLTELRDTEVSEAPSMPLFQQNEVGV